MNSRAPHGSGKLKFRGMIRARAAPGVCPSITDRPRSPEPSMSDDPQRLENVRRRRRGNAAVNWSVTINNFTEEDKKAFDNQDGLFKYSCFGIEKGESGTSHLQGFVSYNQKVRITALQKIWPKGHFEVARNGAGHNRDYCRKGMFFQISNLSSFTRRSVSC